MLNRMLLNGVLAASLLAGSALTLSAQSIVVTEPVAATATVMVPVANEGARAVRSGVSLQEAAAPAPQLMHQGTDRRNVAWMAVGLAALTAGLLIGGDAGSVVAITGGVIGLVGLFRYMN